MQPFVDQAHDVLATANPDAARRHCCLRHRRGKQPGQAQETRTSLGHRYRPQRSCAHAKSLATLAHRPGRRFASFPAPGTQEEGSEIAPAGTQRDVCLD
jgi:hypothetical protein